MATIIDFKDVRRQNPSPPGRPVLPISAQLLLFTGVRYERRAPDYAVNEHSECEHICEAAPQSSSRRRTRKAERPAAQK